MARTFEVATGFHGQKLYQQRARSILPILVRQAEAQNPIFYEALAQEVRMPNPRNLNYPLGCIGRKLVELADRWDSPIPPIEALVVNQQTRLPGPGFDGFLKREGNRWTTKEERRALIEIAWAKIYAYPYWREVLAELGLQMTADTAEDVVAKARGAIGGGEGADHIALKEFVRVNPRIAGLKYSEGPGDAEYPLPSGDRVDVMFSYSKQIHAVEVKPCSSPDADIARGLFQCVKYRAVLEAHARYRHDRRPVSACLVLAGSLPTCLISLRNSLGVEVIENVKRHMVG